MRRLKSLLFFVVVLMMSVNSYSMTPAEEKLLFKTLGEIKGELKRINTRIDNVEKRIDETNKRMDEKFEAMQRYVDKRFEDMDKRFEDMNKRFEDINKRFEDMNKRFEDMNKRLDSMVTLMNRIVIGLFGLVGAFGALLIWDRRSTIKAVSSEIEESLNRKYEIEKLKPLFGALRELAKTDEKLRTILKEFDIL